MKKIVMILEEIQKTMNKKDKIMRMNTTQELHKKTKGYIKTILRQKFVVCFVTTNNAGMKKSVTLFTTRGCIYRNYKFRHIDATRSSD